MRFQDLQNARKATCMLMVSGIPVRFDYVPATIEQSMAFASVMIPLEQLPDTAAGNVEKITRLVQTMREFVADCVKTTAVEDAPKEDVIGLLSFDELAKLKDVIQADPGEKKPLPSDGGLAS